VVRRRLQAAKRADRRFDKLMLHVEAASLTPLDPAWFTDQSVDYSREFNAVRGLEMASQAQRDAFSSSGSSVLETHMRTVHGGQVAAAPKWKVSFGAEMSPAKVVVGWQGSGDDCSEAEEERGEHLHGGGEWVGGGGGCTSNLWWVRWRGVSLFGGASSEVRRCNSSVLV
jgi:hypothetical protein